VSSEGGKARAASLTANERREIAKKAIVDLPVFLTAKNLKDFIDEDLARSATQVKFKMAEGSGGLEGNIALGYRQEELGIEAVFSQELA
jgi:hypothetical protein